MEACAEGQQTVLKTVATGQTPVRVRFLVFPPNKYVPLINLRGAYE